MNSHSGFRNHPQVSQLRATFIPCTKILPLKVCFKRLALDTVQYDCIDLLYRTNRETVLTFPLDKFGQENASQLMQHVGLDREAREALESRWNVQWSTSWASGAPGNRMQRTLLQWYVGFPEKLRTFSNYTPAVRRASVHKQNSQPTRGLPHVQNLFEDIEETRTTLQVVSHTLRSRSAIVTAQ